MNEVAIRLVRLSKLYRMHAEKVARHPAGDRRFRRGKLPGFVGSRAPGLRTMSSSRWWRRRRDVTEQTPRGSDIIWALRDVTLEIKHGELVGIIGGNGAGKSTLLKVISRITAPTAGYAEVYGRIGSLLEVGTGFHRELTGRENVFLNGAILGMKRREIVRKFDEIVAFAELERFIDMPVKHYSTGMHMRLAFSVAAHLEPEILLVDEVLAVGDVRFQKKCLGKMQDVGKQGRTVLFVSHNMSAITRLCERAVLLEEGQVVEDGSSPRVVSAYLNSTSGSKAAREWSDPTRAPGDEVVRLRAVRVRGEEGRILEYVDVRQPVGIELEYEVLRQGYVLMPYFSLWNEEGVEAIMVHDVDPDWRGRPRLVGRYVTTGWIPGNLLAEGRLSVEVGVGTLNPYVRRFNELDVAAFLVVDSSDGDSARGDWGGKMTGVVRPLLKWTTEVMPG